jgi:hypothetical protein
MLTTKNISPDGNTTTNNFELTLPVSPFEKWLMTDAASASCNRRAWCPRRTGAKRPKGQPA